VLGVVLADRIQVKSDDSDEDECRENRVQDDDESHHCLLDLSVLA
jgi:hypothetical protein